MSRKPLLHPQPTKGSCNHSAYQGHGKKRLPYPCRQSARMFHPRQANGGAASSRTNKPKEKHMNMSFLLTTPPPAAKRSSMDRKEIIAAFKNALDGFHANYDIESPRGGSTTISCGFLLESQNSGSQGQLRIPASMHPHFRIPNQSTCPEEPHRDAPPLGEGQPGHGRRMLRIRNGDRNNPFPLLRRLRRLCKA
jgi:hypothetical protein